jgi:23S rRNA (uracil1939-C5)-methyltransferase
MTVKKGQIVELRITDMEVGGKGVARIDGMVVFVDHTVAMDRGLAQIQKKKKNYAEARLVSLLEASPFRVLPPCPYSGFCGGCKWQFIDYPKQLEYKRQHVVDALEHIGMLKEVTVYPMMASEKIFGYRNKMEFSFSDKRWFLPEEGEESRSDSDFALGLHVPGTFNKVLDIEACRLQPDSGNAILNHVKQYVKGSAMPVYGLKSHEGFWRFLMLRHSAFYDQWMVNIITAFEKADAVKPLAESLGRGYPNVISVINNITARKAQIAFGEYELCLMGEKGLKDRIGAYEFEISANSFFQTNTKGAESLYGIVKKAADFSGNETVFDLYCGTGTISLFLSDEVRRVVGFEISATAVDDANKNCLANRVSNCSFVLGDIRESLIRIAEKPDVMIIDPPRAGMHQDVVKQVLAMGPEKIVYVSCNPATLARDVGMMKDHYHLAEVQPVDMFPHTFHVESVARLEKTAK